MAENKTPGRPALINRADIKQVANLDVLDPVERNVVGLRWGVGTGKPLTQQETAKKLKTSVNVVKRLERVAAGKIIEHMAEIESIMEEIGDVTAADVRKAKRRAFGWRKLFGK